MEIKCLPLGDYQANCYIVTDDNSMTAAVIDPGVNSDELNNLLLGYELNYILLTHGHFDHIYGCESLKELYPECKICIHSNDEPCLNNSELNLVGDYDGYLPSINADIVFKGNEELEIVPGVTVKVLHTPGHTPGGVSYRIGNSVFCGDTAFAGGGYGRCDLPGGDIDTLEKTLIKLITTLPTETVFYPGHGASTTLQELIYYFS